MELSTLELVRHAAGGAAVAGGGLALAQSLLARRLRRPSSLAVALGGFVGTFRLLEALGRSRWPRVTVSHAAASAALVALTVLDAGRRPVVVAFAVVEAGVELALETCPEIADIPYIQIPLGALACGPLINWWVLRPELIDKAQLATLDQLCALSPSVLARMRAEIPPPENAPTCDVFHRGASCAQFHASLFTDSMRFAARLYVPIYAVSTLAPKYKRWLHGPRPPLAPLALQYLRTCLCLTMLYQVPLGFACVSPIADNATTVRIAGALTTLALLAEHGKRRASVTKAIAAYTAVAAGARLAELLHLPPQATKAGQFALFAAAMAVLLRSPEASKSRVVQWLYGDGRKATTTTPRADGERAPLDA